MNTNSWKEEEGDNADHNVFVKLKALWFACSKNKVFFFSYLIT